jgi:cob(I)alamin adenosyltransferase
MLDDRIAQMEKLMDGWMKVQGPLEEFILPGGSPASAHLHVARCHVRRAEQLVMTLHRAEPVNAAAIRYLNRLSDALFVMARETNRRAGVPDVTWKPAAPPKKGRAK